MEAFVISMIVAATPLLFAATGELVAERSGVLNLGVEGMMLLGAVTAFAVALSTGSSFGPDRAGLCRQCHRPARSGDRGGNADG